MSIVAALDKVLFFNASSKYSVLRMKTEDSSVPTEARSPYRYHDHLIRFTAVGIELPQTDTVKIKMDGEWKDGKYGLQLQVDHWQEIVPPTLEGVRNYLASGLLKGIGEKTADAIIEKFGINALEILEHQPDRLLEIRGITKERLAEIKDAYAETSRMRVLMTLLAPFKVTPTTAQKIYQHFGPACADIVRQSPFNLCQVPGFGFKRIDAIVQKSGGDLRDPKRVHGALFYALEDARTKDGHLYLEAEALLKAAMQLLNERIPLPQMRVPMSQVEQELSAMIRQDEVVSNHGNVYLPKQFLQESETAQKAVELFLAKPTVVDIAQPLERVKNSLGLNLSKRQSEGVEMVFRHNLSIITGGPGTGKTTVLKTVIEVYRQLYPRQKIVLGAPTGKASRRMAEATGIDEAQTLHSILKLHGDSESKKDRERKPLEAGLLIVDETSMVDMWLIHQLFSRLRPGTKVLLVGDADQLESVGAGDVFHELIGSGVVPVTVLDEIFRQAQDKGIDDWQLALRRKEQKMKEDRRMTFKEQYLNGLCGLEMLEACTEKWHAMKEDSISLRDYLGLTEQEYDAYLQTAPGVSFQELLDSQRKTQRFRVYQLDLEHGETRAFAFGGIDALHKTGFQQPPAAEYTLVYHASFPASK